MNNKIICNLIVRKHEREEFNLFVEYFYSKIKNSYVSHLYIDKERIKIFAVSGDVLEVIYLKNKSSVIAFLKGFYYHKL